MSDTPRPDQREKLAYWFQDDMTPVCESRFVRSLERELYAANERIKLLEEAGDEMEKYCSDYYSSNRWLKAKEAKP
jgi:hypothetical protein